MESGSVVFLRFIDYKDLLKQYQEKTFLDQTFNVVKFHVQVDDLIKEKYGTNPNGNRFTIRSTNGSEVIVHTTNVNGFNGTLNAENAPLCGYCRTNLSSVGIKKPFPVITRRDIEVTQDKHVNPKTGKNEIKITTRKIYSGDILCCDGQCAVTVAMQSEFKNTNAEMYTREVYRYMYPEGPHLKRARPYVLLKHNNGDMSYAEYKKDSNSEFRELVGSIVAPNKRFIIAI